MSEWSKEDKIAFSRSEVMTEFENRLIKAAEALSEKIKVQAQSNIEKKMDMVDELSAKVDNLNKKMEGLAADDGFLENYLDADLVAVEGTQVADEDAQELQEEMGQEELVNDLQAVAEKAISEGQYKIAYDIERTIREILDGE